MAHCIVLLSFDTRWRHAPAPSYAIEAHCQQSAPGRGGRGGVKLEEDIPSVKKSIQQATSQASKLLQPHIHDNKKLEDFINQLMTMEAVITQVRSLKAKFAVNEGESEEDTAELEK
ncbi:unnamed protein product [Pleuronectes platessa]|uniref:Rab3GAP catalytic subunit C-terminal domain-containing protein n=1 Tax=Pleuronectes platessa TaxID=8262 RepID=A0A9N7TQV8_PLEPL|nr:unnamed protein product [Pleuronectes platessa]